MKAGNGLSNGNELSSLILHRSSFIPSMLSRCKTPVEFPHRRERTFRDFFRNFRIRLAIQDNTSVVSAKTIRLIFSRLVSITSSMFIFRRAAWFASHKT